MLEDIPRIPIHFRVNPSRTKTTTPTEMYPIMAQLCLPKKKSSVGRSSSCDFSSGGPCGWLDGCEVGVLGFDVGANVGLEDDGTGVGGGTVGAGEGWKVGTCEGCALTVIETSFARDTAPWLYA
jgi:hypothetical protein